MQPPSFKSEQMIRSIQMHPQFFVFAIGHWANLRPRTSRKIRSDPNIAIFWHINSLGQPGSIARWSLNFFDTAPNPPITTRTHSISHIFLSSAHSGWYFNTFSDSLVTTFMSFGHEMSMISAFLPVRSLIIRSGRFAPIGLEVLIT